MRPDQLAAPGGPRAPLPASAPMGGLELSRPGQAEEGAEAAWLGSIVPDLEGLPEKGADAGCRRGATRAPRQRWGAGAAADPSLPSVG